MRKRLRVIATSRDLWPWPPATTGFRRPPNYVPFEVVEVLGLAVANNQPVFLRAGRTVRRIEVAAAREFLEWICAMQTLEMALADAASQPRRGPGRPRVVDWRRFLDHLLDLVEAGESQDAAIARLAADGKYGIRTVPQAMQYLRAQLRASRERVRTLDLEAAYYIDEGRPILIRPSNLEAAYHRRVLRTLTVRGPGRPRRTPPNPAVVPPPPPKRRGRKTRRKPKG